MIKKLPTHIGYLTTLFISIMSSVFTTLYIFSIGQILAYGDAESHINIAKRVVSSLTPGFGQLGGVWLPLQHLMMVPFVWNDFLWRTGLGGSIVSMICYIIASICTYNIIYLLTKNVPASLVGAATFIFNPNILYLQTTPLGEISLIVMMLLATYFLLRWAIEDNFLYIILGSFFIFCGTLIRYEAWFFVICSLGIIPLVAIIKKYSYAKTESTMILYCCVAFIGMIFWLGWNFLIFKNPLYFMASPYSAKSQQLTWLKEGELPAYHHMWSSIVFYTITSIKNAGIISAILGVVGFFIYFLASLRNKQRLINFLILFLIVSPYIFYILTLYAGISVIFIPELVPHTFASTLFNVRYGIMVVPAIAIFVGLLWKFIPSIGQILLAALLVAQVVLFVRAGIPIDLKDGMYGLSSRRPPLTNDYFAKHYDYGYVMFDDFSRSANPVSLNVPMDKIIYVGNHPYWEESLQHPARYARWLIIRHDENDILWAYFKHNNEFYTYFKPMYRYEKTVVYRRK